MIIMRITAYHQECSLLLLYTTESSASSVQGLCRNSFKGPLAGAYSLSNFESRPVLCPANLEDRETLTTCQHYIPQRQELDSQRESVSEVQMNLLSQEL